MSEITIKQNERKFEYGQFTDRHGSSCSIQKSSVATEDCIWLGIDDPEPKIMSSDAIRLGLRERTFDKNDNGWTKFEIPKEVFFSTRMLLTRNQVKELLPILQKFVETGELSD
jgi:hypothetical protein